MKRFGIPAQLVVPLALVGMWQATSMAGWMPRTLLPAPTDVLLAGWNLTTSGELSRHLAVSTGRAAAGFVIGGSIGFLLGLWTGASRWADRLFDGTVQMLRAVPHLALTPLLILWLGIGESPKVFLVALGVLFPIYLNTCHAIRNVDPGLVEMGRVYGLNNWDLFRRVIFPGSLPGILIGVRYALGVAWLTLIVAETIAASSGIGFLAMNGREFLRTDVVVFCIVLYALLGKGADSVARWLERRCLRWHPAFRPARSGEAA